MPAFRKLVADVATRIELPIDHVDVPVENQSILVQLASSLRNLGLGLSPSRQKDQQPKKCFHVETALY